MIMNVQLGAMDKKGSVSDGFTNIQILDTLDFIS